MNKKSILASLMLVCLAPTLTSCIDVSKKDPLAEQGVSLKQLAEGFEEDLKSIEEDPSLQVSKITFEEVGNFFSSETSYTVHYLKNYQTVTCTIKINQNSEDFYEKSCNSLE